MNCKPGDLAMVMLSGELCGMVIRVIELDPLPSPCGRPLWMYEGNLLDKDGDRYRSVWDHVLRPIRDQDGEDEILRLVGKPETEQA